MRICRHFLLLTGCIPAAAGAAAIPLTVRVANGDPVRAVEFAGSGVVPLAKSADGSLFTGSIAVDPGKTVSQPVLIEYSDFAYPAVLKVHEHLPSVEFPVEARLPTSCTLARIESVETAVTDLPAAISKSIQAARLASIEGNDRCDPALRARAIAAKFRNARRMAQLSQGLFAVPDELIAEYQSLTHSMTAEAEIKRYEAEAVELQAVQLVSLRDAAQRDGEFTKAAAIQQTIADEANSSEKAENAFARVGITKERIAADSAFLTTRADVQAEPAR